MISRRRQSTIPYGRTPSPNKQSTDRFSGFGRSSKDVPPVPSPRTSNANISASTSRDDRPISQATELPSLPSDSRGQAIHLPNGSGPNQDGTRSLAVPGMNGQSFREMQQLPSIPSASPISMTQEVRRVTVAKGNVDGFSNDAMLRDSVFLQQQQMLSRKPNRKLRCKSL